MFITLGDGQGNQEEILSAEVFMPRTHDLDFLIREPAQDERMELELANL